MKKRISILTLVILSICVTNAQDTIRSITAGDWTKTLEKDVTYTLEPFGSNISIKEGTTNLHSLVLPETITFSSTLDTVPHEEGVVINGVRWATCNVGAHGQFVANPEDFGGYYQWGRKGDGHEQPTSGTTTTLSSTDDPGHSNFILTEEDPYDWRVPQNDALWNAGSETTPVKATNDPCPAGWRVPTLTELQSLETVTKEWSNLNGVDGYFIGDGEPKLFLPAAGIRNYISSGYDFVGTSGNYWSSSIGGTNAYSTYFYSTTVAPGTNSNSRASGFSIRCIAEQ